MRRRNGDGMFWVAVALAMTGGLALRIFGADGPLWLDELVSVDFVTGANGPNGILTAHDNNHVLNTLWLAMVGPQAPVMLQRALAIALSVAAIPLAGLLLRPRGTAAAIAGTVVFALAVPFVVYGSEARGYAGLLICTLAMILAADRHLATDPPGARWWAAAATGFGVAFQPLMALACVSVSGAVFLVHLRRSRSFDAALSRSIRFLAPSIVVGMALVALAAWQIHRTGLAFGGVKTFTVENFVSGYAGMLTAVLGLPAGVPSLLPLALIAVVLAVVALRPATDRDLPLVLTGVVVVPALLFLARPPNTEMVRYHMVAGIVAAVGLALALSVAARAGTAGRLFGAVVAAVWIAGQSMQVAGFLSLGRAPVQPLVAEAAAGLAEPIVIGSRRPLLAVYYVRALARETGRRFILADRVDCVRPPDLLLDWVNDRPTSDVQQGDEAPCGAVYDLVGDTRPFWLSGMEFGVYRLRTEPAK